MGKLNERSALMCEIKALQEKLNIIDEAILADLAEKIKSKGSTTVEYEGKKVTVTIPVTVKWDQGELRSIADRIRIGGDDPENYIDVKFNVRETLYKAWPEPMQKIFFPARTVTLGKARLEVKE